MTHSSTWFARLVLGGAILLLTRIGIAYVVHPIAAVSSHQITLGSPAAITAMRVSGGMFLGIALLLLECLVSARRLLRGLGVLLTIALTITVVRLVGLAVDGPAPFTLQVLKPEIALVVLSSAAYFLERRRQSIETGPRDAESRGAVTARITP